MEFNYKEIAERAVAAAAQSNIRLDYSRDSIEKVDQILGGYFERLSDYDGEKGADTLWNIAVHFGIYLGETLLRLQLGKQGYQWCMEKGMPILKKDDGNQISPITKAHKRILNGPEDNVKSFCDVAFMVADGKFPTNKVHRAVDVELASGQCFTNVLYREVGDFIRMVVEGEEDFLVLNSHDGFLQFYGVDDQFVAEMRVNLPHGDFRMYSFTDAEKQNQTDRIQLVTPFGQYTPTEQEVLSLELLETVVREYYENVREEDFLKKVSYIETTEETKGFM